MITVIAVSVGVCYLVVTAIFMLLSFASLFEDSDSFHGWWRLSNHHRLAAIAIFIWHNLIWPWHMLLALVDIIRGK